jgi:hypothetical protein
MPRTILDESHVHPTIRPKIANNHAEIVREVKAAIAANDVVVVGMAQNPHPKKARRVLDAASRLRPRASGDEYDRTGDLTSPKRKPQPARGEGPHHEHGSIGVELRATFLRTTHRIEQDWQRCSLQCPLPLTDARASGLPLPSF